MEGSYPKRDREKNISRLSTCQTPCNVQHNSPWKLIKYASVSAHQMSVPLSLPNKAWRPVAVTIQFVLDSTRDGDWRANAILGLGNPRVERIFPSTKAPKQSVLPLPLLPKVHRSLYKRVRPSFVTSCHLLPTHYLPPAPLVFLTRITRTTHIAHTTLVCFKINTRNPRSHAPIHKEHSIPKGARPDKGN